METTLVAPGKIEVLAAAYAEEQGGLRRATSGVRASYDGALLLLALVEELRGIRAALEAREFPSRLETRGSKR